MKVVITGGRDYGNTDFMFKFLDAFREKFGIDFLVEGGAAGADYWAKIWATSRHVPKITCKADWNKHPKAAGVIRNQEMIDDHQPDICIAFPGGKGTADMIKRCKKAGIRVIELDR